MKIIKGALTGKTSIYSPDLQSHTESICKSDPNHTMISCFTVKDILNFECPVEGEKKM